MIRNYIVAEYSASQKCFHVHDFTSMLKDNIESLTGKYECDYIPIGIFETEEEAHEYIKKVRELMEIPKQNWVNDLLKSIFK